MMAIGNDWTSRIDYSGCSARVAERFWLGVAPLRQLFVPASSNADAKPTGFRVEGRSTADALDRSKAWRALKCRTTRRNVSYGRAGTADGIFDAPPAAASARRATPPINQPPSAMVTATRKHPSKT